MSILAALPALLFGLSGLVALVVLAVSACRAITAWGELARALDTGDEIRIARVTIFEAVPARPQLRLVEGGVRPRAAALLPGLRAAA